MQWKNYDYRAVTAGTIFCLMAAIVFASTPSTALECSRPAQRCELVRASLRSREARAVPLSGIDKARKECDRSKGKQACDWTVRLVVKGDTGEVFTGIEAEQEAERYVQAIRDFLEGRGPETLKLHRAADRTWPYGLAALGVVLVILGIRKNLVDKGHA